MSFPAIYLFSVTFFYKNLFFSSTYKKCDYIPLFILLKHSSLCDRKTIKSLVVCVIPGLFRLHKKTCSQTVLTDLHRWKQTVHLSSRTQNCNGVVVYRQLDLNMKQVEQKFSFARGSFFFFFFVLSYKRTGSFLCLVNLFLYFFKCWRYYCDYHFLLLSSLSLILHFIHCIFILYKRKK